MEDLVYILVQELYENGLFNLDELSEKYRMDDDIKTELKLAYDELYSED